MADKAKQARGQTDEPLLKFIKRVGPRDVIITFNWDTLVERYLDDSNRSFTLGPNDNGISVLKLHGSFSWVQLPENKELKDQAAYGELSQGERLYYIKSNQDLSDIWTQLDEAPYIVTPTWHKTPLETDFLRSKWFEAFQALGEAAADPDSKIIVIGYSLPPEDLHARSLLRVGIGLQNGEGGMIHLIDPDPAVAGRFYTMVTKRLQYSQKCFTGDEILG